MNSPNVSRPRRPLLLLLTMLLCIVMGWSGVVSGCNTIHSYRSGEALEAPPLQPGTDAREQEEWMALLQALQHVYDHARAVRFPLGIANLLLSGLLVIAATRAASGRPGSRSLAMQAVVANAAHTAVNYWLTRTMRAEEVPIIAQSFPRSVIQGRLSMGEEHLTAYLSSLAWTGFRLQFVCTLMAYGVAFIALAIRATRAYLGPVEAHSGANLDPGD